VSLGLDQSPLALPENATPAHKSAGLAFVLSLIVPGAGQMYCGKTGRGGFTLALFVAAIGLTTLGFGLGEASVPNEITGIAMVAALVLYVFSFLDAYYVAREINAGTDSLVDANNPRVAVTLNLLTNGFGYWYLGEPTKGWMTFIVLGLTVRGLAYALGNSPWSLLLAVVPCTTALDAYRIARKQIEEGRQASPPAATTASAVETRLPAAIPVALACLLALGLIVLAALGLLMPNFNPIDQSRSVTDQQSNPKSYENRTYGVRFLAPANWELQSDKQFLVKTETLGGACQVALLGQGSLPFGSVDTEVEALSRDLLQKNPNFHATGKRAAALGNLGDGREAAFAAQVGNQQVMQSYLVARKSMATYVLITTLASMFAPKCEKDTEWIRENVHIGK
jgi:TM2 domain-containing membrane protein YozV